MTKGNILAMVCCALISASLAGCGGSDGTFVDTGPAQTRTVFGPGSRMGFGKARSFVVLDADGAPISIGVRMNDAALTFLPDGPPPTYATEYTLQLPKEAPAPFTEIALYYTQGHPPNETAFPHFHTDFLTVNEATRDIITPDDPRHDVAPDPQFVPQDHQPLDLHLPQLGHPWVDYSAPIFHGQALRYNYNYGFWDGQMAFINVDFAKSFLESKEGQTTQMKQPAAFQKEGFYPLRWSISYDTAAHEYVISLDGLRKA